MIPNSTRRPMPPTYFRLLAHGDTHGEYRGSTGVIGALVGIAVEHGVRVEQLLAHLTNPRNTFAYQTMQSRRVRESNVREWYIRSAAQQQKTFDANEYRVQLATIREAATVGTWRNRYKLEQETGEAVTVNGSVLRRALQAHISLALNNPGIDYPASERVIAETARISRPAVKRATEMLIGYGVLRRRRPPGKLGRGTAAWYRLDASGKWLETLLANANTIDAAALSRFECHSVFRHGNGVRFDVWAYIVATPGADVKEIAAATGAHTRTVRRVIRRLAALELVERGSDGTAASRIADDEISAALDIAAFESGMAQRSAKQAERYEQDRQQHAETILRIHGSWSRLATRHKRVQRLLAAWKQQQQLERVDYETGEVVTLVQVA